MKFFNIDMHISIIHDVKNIFKNMGHEIDSICMSGHMWVNNEKQGTTDVITPHNWKNINQLMCDKFYDLYKNKLEHYDGFITSYPPAFALLFEKWNKPIIVIACTRFDYPCINNVSWLIEGLQRLRRKNILIPIANNIFDKKYCEKYTNFEWTHIQSLCDYMNAQYTYNPDKKIITWGRSRLVLNIPEINNNFSISKQYNRINIINSYNGVIHIPYNISIMSAFEHYYSNFPMFVPTIPCLKKWIQRGDNILSEIYFNPHIFEIEKSWLEYTDWLRDDVMKYTIKFNDENELYNLLKNTNYCEVSNKMKEDNFKRRTVIYKQWEEVIKIYENINNR